VDYMSRNVSGMTGMQRVDAIFRTLRNRLILVPSIGMMA